MAWLLVVVMIFSVMKANSAIAAADSGFGIGMQDAGEKKQEILKSKKDVNRNQGINTDNDSGEGEDSGGEEGSGEGDGSGGGEDSDGGDGTGGGEDSGEGDGTGGGEDSGEGDGTGGGEDSGEGDGAGGGEDSGTDDGSEKPTIENLSAEWDGEKRRIVLRYDLDGDYVNIQVKKKTGGYTTIAEEYEGESFAYEYKDWEEYLKEFTFLVVPYRRNEGTEDINGETREVPCDVIYPPAAIKNLYVDYDLERQVLYVDWDEDEGDDGWGSVKNVKVYLDDSDNPLNGAYMDNEGSWVASLKLEPRSTHKLKIVPINNGNQEGTPQDYTLVVDDYEAKITDYTIEYNEETKRLEMKWESMYTQYVSVYLNDEELAENYKENSLTIDCVLQPGASYKVFILPYNGQDEEGEELEEDISFGEFEVPYEFSASVMNVDVKDAAGNYTGFTKPLIKLQWEAQKQAVYEVYRAEKDKKGAYAWIATVRADKEEVYTYIDEKAGFGDYYYKIRRKIVEDDYLEQELYTALSDAEHVRLLVPRPKVKVKLSAGKKILLTMESAKEYVSGYEIYRKYRGKYEKIASTTDNKYVDKKLKFGKTYSYKVKAYYYDVNTGKKVYGKYSKAASVKNTIGAIKAEALAVSSDTVKLSWTPAVNADTYEIYGKSGMMGDSYVLLATTKQLSLKYKLKQNTKYFFMIKAYQAKDEKRTYFSSTEVSVQTGFSAPRGLKVTKTTYKKDRDALVQEDTLSWNRVYGAKGYYIEVYDAEEKEYVGVGNIRKGSKTSYTISNPVTAEAKARTYRVSAYLGKRIECGDTIKVRPQLGTVQKVNVVKNREKVKVSWEKAEGAESYKIYRSNGSMMFFVGETDETCIADKGLSAGISYSYYVQAVNNMLKLTGDMSEPAVCKMAQGKVSGLKAVNTAGGNVRLTWKEAPNAQKYVVYYKGAGDKGYRELKKLPADVTAYVHKRQARGTSCSYRVVAVQKNSGGISVESKPAQVKVYIKK